MSSEKKEIGLAIVGCGTIGRIRAMLARDYPTVMALSFMTAFLVLLGTLLADLSYALVDPRVSYD